MTQALADKWVRRLTPNLSDDLCYSLKTLALHTPDREICGLIYYRNGREQYWPIVNDADDPANTFHMSADSLRIAIALFGEDDIIGMYHSHRSGQPYMSIPDAENATVLYENGCTWRYFIVTSDQVTEYRYVG